MSQQHSAFKPGHGMAAEGLLVHLSMMILFGVLFYTCFMAQVTSTINAVFGLMQSGTLIDPHMTAQSVLDLINGSMDGNAAIAQLTGWAVQGFMMTLAFPSLRSLVTRHKKHNLGVVHPLVTKHDELMWKLEWGFKIALVGMDIVTDMVWAARGHDIFAGTVLGFIPQIHNFGTFIGSLFYTLCVVGGVLFFGKRALAAGEALVEDVRLIRGRMSATI